MSLDCRFCAAPLDRTFVDLGASPLANSYLTADQLSQAERFYPLHTYVCESCWLVQLPEIESPEAIFRDYAYFSSVSESWLRHAETYVDMMVERFRFDRECRVIEIASNDGYLLQYFQGRGIPVLGIEPARNVAKAAVEKGIPTHAEFFGSELARRLAQDGVRGDLLIGNNVFAHTPHLNDFAAGLALALEPCGIVTLELPHLQRLVEGNQFDTIYHEHYSYFSLTAAKAVLEAHGLRLFDVEELPTHGGSLRLFACHADDESKPTDARVKALVEREARLGYTTPEPYERFGEQVRATKRRLLEFLLRAKAEGKSVVGYGAPAKGNTLLNYCGIRTDFLDYTVDLSRHKQGLFLPGTRIPIHSPEVLKERRPDYVLILPWNLRDEIVAQMSEVFAWGGRFVIAIPEVQVVEPPQGAS